MANFRHALLGINRQALLFMAYSAVLHIGLMGFVDIVLNFYFVELGHSPETIGLLQSLPRLGGFLTSIPIAFLANHIGARHVLVSSTVGIALAVGDDDCFTKPCLAGGKSFSGGLWACSYGASQIVTPPFMVELASEQYHTRFFAYHNVTTMLAIGLGNLVGGFIPSAIVLLSPNTGDATLYRIVLVVGSVTILGGILPFYFGLTTKSSDTVHKINATEKLPQDEKYSVAAKRTIPWAYLILLSLPLLFFGFTGGLTFPFYNLFFRDTFELSDSSVGTILSLGWLAMGLITLANPWWERRFGLSTALGITLTIAAIAFLALSIAPTLLFAIPAFLLAIAARNTMQPFYQPLVMNALTPDLRNVVSSIGLVLWNIGWFSSTAIAGFWQTTYGFDFIMQVVAVGVFLTAISIFMIFSRKPLQQTI